MKPAQENLTPKLTKSMVTPEVAFRIAGRCKFRKSGCWEWLGLAYLRKKKHHWPVTSIGSMMIGARQVSWLIIRAELPASGIIKPMCGNDLCVNPIHLENKVNNPKADRQRYQAKWRLRAVHTS